MLYIQKLLFLCFYHIVKTGLHIQFYNVGLFLFYHQKGIIQNIFKLRRGRILGLRRCSPVSVCAVWMGAASEWWGRLLRQAGRHPAAADDRVYRAYWEAVSGRGSAVSVMRSGRLLPWDLRSRRQFPTGSADAPPALRAAKAVENSRRGWGWFRSIIRI